MNDIELLREQVRQHPEDETLLGVFADCFRENGDDRMADVVVEYRNRKRLIEIMTESGRDGGDYERQSRECDRLWFLMGMRRIEPGDILSYDDSGRVFPVGSSRWSRRVGIATAPAEIGGEVMLTLYPTKYAPGTPAVEPQFRCEVSRL